MKHRKKIALAGALALALSGPILAQTTDSDNMAASGAMGTQHQLGGGTTLHKQDKATHARGASAARAASALGTNDKGQPH
jgi:hypothetical protein